MVWLWTALALVAGVALLVTRVWRLILGGSSQNPFMEDVRKLPQELVTNREAWRRVLKQAADSLSSGLVCSFLHHRVPDQLDAVVIGSSTGGLVVAAVLAKAGKRVLVLEQHTKAGIHYVGQVNEVSLLRIALDQITEGQLDWAPMDSPFDVVMLEGPNGRKEFPMYIGEKAYVQGLKEKFPHEKAAIDKYMKMVKEVGKGIPHMVVLKIIPLPLVKLLDKLGLLAFFSPFLRAATQSLADVLNQLPASQDLKAVLSYIYPTYGVYPKNASFSMHAILINYFLEGAFYPRGGASEIPFHIILVIQKAGGAVLTNSGQQWTVCCWILLEEPVDYVIPMNTYCLRELAVCQEGDLSMERYLSLSRDQAVAHIPYLFVTSASAKDPTWKERFPDQSTLMMMLPARYEWFEEWQDEPQGKRGDDYEALKNSFIDASLSVLMKLHPQLAGKVESILAQSPLSQNFFLAASHGQTYGTVHDLRHLQPHVMATIRAQSPIPNLCLTGQDVFTWGLFGALPGALLCSSTILQRNVHLDLLCLQS